MRSFEQWVDLQGEFDAVQRGWMHDAYLAGQSSAEQRVKELEKKCSSYALLTKAQEEQLTNHRNHAERYREAINTMQSERDANAILTAELAALKAQAREHKHEWFGVGLVPTHYRCVTCGEIKKTPPSTPAAELKGETK